MKGPACGATVVLVPEKEVDFDKDVIEPIRQARLGGRTHFMVIVAEGVPGGAYRVAEQIKKGICSTIMCMIQSSTPATPVIARVTA